jgi:hypothetical protein
MSDAILHEIPARRRRHFGRAESGRRDTVVELVRPAGRRAQARSGPDSSPDPAPEPGRRGFGRWLLDACVISFAYGGCIHNIHPHYVDFLHELTKKNRG